MSRQVPSTVAPGFGCIQCTVLTIIDIHSPIIRPADAAAMARVDFNIKAGSHSKAMDPLPFIPTCSLDACAACVRVCSWRQTPVSACRPTAFSSSLEASPPWATSPAWWCLKLRWVTSAMSVSCATVKSRPLLSGPIKVSRIT